LAAGLIIGVLYGFYRIRREVIGRGKSGGLIAAGMKKANGVNELEQFIASYRANAARTALSPHAIDPAPEHNLGTALSTPKLGKLLVGPQRVVYLLLKTGLADHHLFANARLGDFITDTPANLADQRVDFLICDRNFDPIVTVDILNGVPAAEALAAKSELFQQLGIDHIRFKAEALPKRHEIRSLVLREKTNPAPTSAQ
jgi:hypothetical protein